MDEKKQPAALFKLDQLEKIIEMCDSLLPDLVDEREQTPAEMDEIEEMFNIIDSILLKLLGDNDSFKKLKKELQALEGAKFETQGFSRIPIYPEDRHRKLELAVLKLLLLLEIIKIKLLINRRFGLAEIKREIMAIEKSIFNPVFGLSEIKSEVSAIEAMLTDPTFGLSEIKSEVSAIEAMLSDPTFGLSEIKAEISTIEANLIEIQIEISAILSALSIVI